MVTKIHQRLKGFKHQKQDQDVDVYKAKGKAKEKKTYVLKARIRSNDPVHGQKNWTRGLEHTPRR